MKIALVTSSRLLAGSLERIAAPLPDVQVIVMESVARLVEEVSAASSSVIVCDIGSEGADAPGGLDWIWSTPHLASIPVIGLVPPGSAALSESLGAHPQVAKLLEKPVPAEVLLANCRQLVRPQSPKPQPQGAVARSATPLLDALGRMPEFLEGFEWSRLSEPLRFEGAKAAAFSEASGYALGVANALAAEIPVGEVTSIIVSSGDELAMLCSAAVQSAEAGDFHVVGCIVKGGTDPDRVVAQLQGGSR